MGATVVIISELGNGAPDALVGFRGSNLLWDFKKPGSAPTKRPGKGKKPRKLTGSEEAQAGFDATWMGMPRVEIETVDDVMRSLLNADRNKPLDYSEVADDFVAAVVKVVRQKLPDFTTGL